MVGGTSVRDRSVLVGALGASVGVGMLGLAVNLGVGVTALQTTGCNADAGTTIIAPTTGITVQAQPLVATFGCGQQPGQVYKYAAVVEDSTGRPVYAEVYDCFADATFVNLAAAPNGSLSFSVLVYAWDFLDYDAHASAIGAGINTIAVAAAADASAPNPFLVVPATYSTSCTATQTTNIVQLAVCGPLAPEGSTPLEAGAGVDSGRAVDSGEAD